MLAMNLSIAWRCLRAHRLRSLLTMLGIIIGVAAVVTMVAIAAGARDRISAQIRSLGANAIGIVPGSAMTSGARLGRGTVPYLSQDDALAIGAEVSGLVAVAPALVTSAQFTFGSQNWAGEVAGVTPEYFMVRDWGIAEGRELIAEENDRAAKVVLLGASVREKLFADADPVGAVVRIRDVPFTVVGVLAPKGQNVQGNDQDDIALVPLSTARQQLVGVSRASPRLVHAILVKFAEGLSAEDVTAAIAGLLRERHRVRPGQEDTFVIRNFMDVAAAEQGAVRVLSILLTAVATVSLVVGGIGIMNIMLVSVRERTREIGLRSALGARERDILVQFLVEALTLAVLGGALGALAGVGASLVIASLAGWSVLIDLSTLLLAIASSGAIGVFFGFYPARMAARLDPIAALRYE
jgi:putative ABC transport system permease protein